MNNESTQMKDEIELLSDEIKIKTHIAKTEAKQELGRLEKE